KPKAAVDRTVGPVDSGLIAPESVVDHDSLLVEVVQRGTILRVGGSAGEREIVVNGRSRAEQLILPVCVRGSLIRDGDWKDIPEDDLSRDEVPVLAAAHHVESLVRRRHPGLHLVLDRWSTDATLCRLDENDAIGAARA